MLSASIMAIFIQALSLNIYEFTDLLLYIPEQILGAYNSIELISNQGYGHWLFVFVSVGIFGYYFYRFFGNNIKEINKNIFLLIFFVNSSLLAFVINEYSIFLFFPFLVTLVKIISELRDNLIFETAIVIAIILNSYPYNF